jgi:hypothetical protein
VFAQFINSLSQVIANTKCDGGQAQKCGKMTDGQTDHKTIAPHDTSTYIS